MSARPHPRDLRRRPQGGIVLQAPKDFAAGLLFAGIGAASLIIGAGYRGGSLLQMGPGYFPRLVGALLLLLGVVVSLVALRTRGEALEGWKLRPLILVLGAVVAFGALLERLGLLPALGALVLLAALAQRGRRPLEVTLLALVLGLIAWLVFIRGLGLPIELWVAGGEAP